MYRIGQRSKRQRRWSLAVAVIVSLILLGLLAYWILQLLADPKTTLQQSAAVTSTVAAKSETRKLFETAEFKVELPAEWKLLPKQPGPYNLYRYQGGSATNTQTLEIFIDTIPANFPVNRVAVVEANGAQIGVNGGVSDNCIEFTKAETRASAQGTRAKWNGVDFLCDLNNYERNVVGTSSLGAVNSLSLASPGGATRKVFFTFTDHNINYNFDALQNALTTFRLK